MVAAAAIDPAAGWTRWERMVEEIRSTWDERDRQLSAPAFPLVPGAAQWAGVFVLMGAMRSLALVEAAVRWAILETALGAVLCRPAL